MITRAAALSLSAWLAREHPPLFQAMTRAAARTQLGRLGDDTGYFDLSADPPTIDPMVADISPPLQDISTFDVSGQALPDVSFDPSVSSTTSGGFLSSVGSALSSAVSGVGGFLTSSQGLTSLANVATQYFKTQGTLATAQTQQAVLQTQLQRAQAGQAAAPITYTRNPYTGQLTPVLQTGAGYAPLTASALTQLTPFLNQYGIWIAAAVGILVVLSALSKR